MRKTRLGKLQNVERQTPEYNTLMKILVKLHPQYDDALKEAYDDILAIIKMNREDEVKSLKYAIEELARDAEYHPYEVIIK